MRQVKIIAILLLTISYTGTFAQLCNGSLGDPVVNITFGTGGGSGTILNTLTNYNYVANDCPNDGNYTIGYGTTNCFGSSWYTVLDDHTPADINGNMMIVNASYTPGDFFIKTIDGLCQNTTYEFAAWIMNVLKPTACGGNGIQPNVTFSIETTSGTVLQSYSTGNIPSGLQQWKQYGFYFSTTTENSVVVRMVNNAPGGCGNDLLLDDITFRPCGPLVTAGIVGNAGTVDVCAGDPTVFILQANVSSGYTDPVYQWQVSTDNGATWTNIAGANNTTYSRAPETTAATYQYRLAVAQRANSSISACFIVSNIVNIVVNGKPVPAASGKGNCSGDTLFLNATGGVSYSWSGPGNFISNIQSPQIPNAAQANSGTYYVNVISAKGCISNDSVTVNITEKPGVNAGPDTTICEGAVIFLNAVGSNVTSWLWTPPGEVSDAAVPNPSASPKQTTDLLITVFNGGCKNSDTVKISVNKKPVADAGPDKAIIKGQSVILNGFAGGSNITFIWTPAENIDNVTKLSPQVDPQADKLYTLHVTSASCGIATDDVLVKVYKELYIPNAFTPNGDGINDNWQIETLKAFPGAEVKVYNRYGEKVFDNQGNLNYWDGKYKKLPLGTGAYPFTIDLRNNMPVIRGVVFIIK